MSERSFVEKPFLDQLAALGWHIIDQGQGVPGDPALSLRMSFREIILPDVFRDSLNAINQTEQGQPRLFYTNQLLIRTCGDRADFGTITATDEEFFFPWKDIYPEKYRKFVAPLGQVREQETLIQGMLPKETLLDLVRTCSVFMNAGAKRVKVMAR